MVASSVLYSDYCILYATEEMPILENIRWESNCGPRISTNSIFELSVQFV
jgi:hypothetical protein